MDQQFKLYFDSGATKCDCILLNAQGSYLRHVSDCGINASYMLDEQISIVFQRIHRALGDCSFSEILFSGAGCGNPHNADRVRRCLTLEFPCQQVEVVSDLLGACRLLSPGRESLVAILGTGASACLYDGSNIVHQAPSLGFMLGDEGSGTYIGKLLIQTYLRQEMPDNLRAAFEQYSHLDRSAIIQRVYREPSPNLFFSSFARFVSDNKHNPFYHSLLLQAFTDFFQRQITVLPQYASHNLSLMGSVAFFFQDEIRQAGKEFHIHNVTAVASPLSLLSNSK